MNWNVIADKINGFLGWAEPESTDALRYAIVMCGSKVPYYMYVRTNHNIDRPQFCWSITTYTSISQAQKAALEQKEVSF